MFSIHIENMKFKISCYNTNNINTITMGQGEPGKVGAPGTPGPKGDKGETGPQGLVNWATFDDANKSDLINKLKAYKEFVGPKGDSGDRGDKGDIGSVGAKGDKGDRGEKGDKGDKGDRGDQGAAGIPGQVSYDDMKTKSMWCADGELCKIPAGKKGIDWGYGASKIYDDAQLHIATDDFLYLDAPNTIFVPKNTALQFGDGFDRQVDAGKIAYGRFDGNADGSLNIVGGGKNGQARLVRVWDTLQLGDAIFRQDDDWVRITGDKNNQNAYNKGLAAARLWARDKLYVNGRDILAELDDLKNNVIRKDRKYGIQSNRGGYLSDQGGWKGGVGDWENMRFVQQ
jgi:hypothetical protein